MALAKRFIGILSSLFSSLPDDVIISDSKLCNQVYSEYDIENIAFSSLHTVYNVICKLAKNKKYSQIFSNNRNGYNAENSNRFFLKIEGGELLIFFDSVRKLQFDDELDNRFKNEVCDYLYSYITAVLYGSDPLKVKQERMKDLPDVLKKRRDYLIIITYAFYQILFAHFHHLYYGIELDDLRNNYLLFNKELNDYQFSLPYEDQVTCSYFVFRYIYTPEERNYLYNKNPRHKYDCGNHLQGSFSYLEISKLFNSSQKDSQNSQNNIPKNLSYDDIKKQLSIISQRMCEKIQKSNSDSDDLAGSKLHVVHDTLNWADKIVDKEKEKYNNAKLDCKRLDALIKPFNSMLEKTEMEERKALDLEAKKIKVKIEAIKKILQWLGCKRENPKYKQGDKSSSFGHFIDDLRKINIHTNAVKPANDHAVLKLYYLIKSMKEGLFFGQNSTKKFDIFKTLNNNDIENFVYDDFNNETTNGFYTTIVCSEIKKDIGYLDTFKLTRHYVKSMNFLNDIMISIKEDYLSNSTSILFSNYCRHIKCYKELSLAYSILPKSTFPNNSSSIMQSFLALLYLNSIDACLETTIKVNSFIINNEEKLFPFEKRGVFKEAKFLEPIFFDRICSDETYKKVCSAIECISKDLLPPTKNRKKYIMKLLDEILMFENDTQTKSYNQNNCTLRFLASMVWTLMLTRKGLISDLPNNKYYRHRTQSNIKNLRSLFSDSRYSIFKKSIFTSLFEEVNNYFSEKTVSHLENVNTINSFFNIFHLSIKLPNIEPENTLNILELLTYNSFFNI